MTRYLSNLAGLAFRSPEAKLVVKALKPGSTLFLKRDPVNQWDENAIEVWVPNTTLTDLGLEEYIADDDSHGLCIGYCEKLMNGPLAQDMDHGKHIVALVSNVYDDYEQPVKTGNWARPLIEVIATDAPADDEPAAA